MIKKSFSKYFTSGQISKNLSKAVIYQSNRSFFALNQIRAERNLMNMSKRFFAFPNHMKLGLPNLSPTMEKVCIILHHQQHIYFCYLG
jgi:hypothetical protein